MKICTRCGVEKAITEFSKCSTSRDGLRGVCKWCTKSRDVERNSHPATIARYKERRSTEEYKQLHRAYSSTYRDREGVKEAISMYDSTPERREARLMYNKTSEGKQAQNRASKRQKEVFPERFKARAAANNAVANGSLVKLPCWVCGELEVEGHHPVYSMPLDVVWLCKKHHDQTHNETNSST